MEVMPGLIAQCVLTPTFRIASFRGDPLTLPPILCCLQ